MGCHTELKFSIGEIIGYILFRWVLKSVFLGNYHKTKVEGHPLKWGADQVRSGPRPHLEAGSRAMRASPDIDPWLFGLKLGWEMGTHPGMINAYI